MPGGIMGKIIIISITIVFVSAIVHAVDITKIEPLRAQNEIDSAIEISKNMNVISNLVKLCADKGNSHEECLCKNKSALEEQSSLIRSVLKEHPSWLKKGWLRFTYTDGGDRTLNAIGLKKQSEKTYKCI
jgi:hypothetical protein